MSCGRPGRCCNGVDCTENVGSCKCGTCGGSGDWYVDNTCAVGACWLQEGSEYVCSQMNPCECKHLGGEFSGAGTACPGPSVGPPPPPPAPPPGEDPGPVIVYCCFQGGCFAAEYFCDALSRRYSDLATCLRSCRYIPPPDIPDPPPPDPVGPCDPPCNGCQSCLNGACVNVCNTVCCNGACCPAGQQCVGGVCQPVLRLCLRTGCAPSSCLQESTCQGYFIGDCYRSATWVSECPVEGGSVGEVNPFP